VGHAAYKINDTSQANEWLDPLQIPKQIALNRESNAVSGSIFYGYAKLAANSLGIKDKLHGIYVAGREPSSSVPEDRQLIISSPANGYETSASKISILGSGDPDQPMYLGDTKVDTSEDGYFTVYVDLENGENSFVFKHKGKETVLNIKKKGTAATPYKMTTLEFKPGSFSPTQAMTMKTGQKVNFSCQAPKGAKVWVEFGAYKVNLTSTESVNSSDGTSSKVGGNALTPVKYNGTFTFPTVNGNQRVLSLGKPVFVLDYNGNKIINRLSNTISVQSSKYYKYAVVNTTESEVPARSGPSSSYSRVTPLINGAADYVVGLQNNFYLLKSGVWVAASNVTIVNDKAIKTNTISSIRVKANSNYTDFTFKMPVNTVFDVSATSGTVILTLYNTNGIKVGTSAPNSSIYSSVICQNILGDAKYTFRLKAADNYFGYYTQYKNGKLVFSLKNAPKIEKSGNKPLSGLKVLLDAGHGGNEPGAIGPLGLLGLFEKDINLSIALNTRKYLKALGATVIMTRTSDTTVSLTDRANLIRKEKPDIAVSIHNNSMDVTVDYTKHKGFLTLYSQAGSRTTAGFMQEEMVKDLSRENDGYRWQSLSVCIPTQSPAILVECGFMSNPAEYEWLVDYENQVRIANSLGKAIENWAYKNTR
jgi:N-acetylmuramoyl-L-alanine amidase